MEILLDIVSLLSACGDLTLHFDGGPRYPTLTLRQGAGFYRCMGLIEDGTRAAIAIAQPLIIVVYGRRIFRRAKARRRNARISHLSAQPRL